MARFQSKQKRFESFLLDKKHSVAILHRLNSTFSLTVLLFILKLRNILTFILHWLIACRGDRSHYWTKIFVVLAISICTQLTRSYRKKRWCCLDLGTGSAELKGLSHTFIILTICIISSELCSNHQL